jgi:hypothetical protein
VSTEAKPVAHGSNEHHEYRVPPGSRWAGAWRIAAGIGALGLGIAAYGYFSDRARFPFSYLFGYFVALSLALGNLFFVLVLYVTKASWGITVRRIAELFFRPMQVFPLLIIPLVLTMPHLFPWLGAKTHAAEIHTTAAEATHLAEVRGLQEREPAALRDLPYANAKAVERAQENDERRIVEHKRFYLNRWFFIGRLLAYLAIWVWLSSQYFRWSTEQDKTRALETTAAAQRFAPAAIMLFAVTLTFFAFDWLLSLNATWYSTIFGVYIFAQTALVQMAALILVAFYMRRSGLFGDALTVEHFHDMGKLLFGWIVFWSYIAFAQFFLYWYSNIPDEVAWYHDRWGDNGGTWKGVSLALVALHFFVPFWFLMSRNIKRRLPLLALGAATMVVMHIVEVYWVVMPNFGPFEPSLIDLGCLLGVVGVYMATVLYPLKDYSLVPIGDPRLERALEFENA